MFWIGAGEHDRLRLGPADVLELHRDIEVARERARVRTRRTSPTGNLTVNTTVGCGTGTPSGWRCATSTYRRACRRDTW
jgi:hypothetical protein